MLRLATLTFLLCTAVGCDSTGGTDTDLDSDTSTDTGTGTGTGTGTDTGTGTGTGTGTDTETNTPDKCDDRPRFKCEGGTSNCARVCGTVGGEFFDYYVDERALLDQIDCDPGGDVKLTYMLDDTKSRVFFNLFTNEVGAPFAVGGDETNSVVDFSQEGSSRDAFSTVAWKKEGNERTWFYGEGSGQLYKFDAKEDGGEVLGKIVITKSYNVKGQELLQPDPLNGNMLIEFQAICK